MSWTQYDPEDKSTYPPIWQHVFAIWLENGKARVAGIAMLGLGGWYEIKKLHKNGEIRTEDKKEIVFDEGSLGWMPCEMPDWWKPKETK